MKRSSNAMTSSLLWTHSLCSVESSCCSALTASTPTRRQSCTRISICSPVHERAFGRHAPARLCSSLSLSLDLPWSPACGVVLVLAVALNTQHAVRDGELDGMLPPSSSRGVPPYDTGSICIGFSIGSVCIGVCMAFVGGGWWSCTLPPPLRGPKQKNMT